MAGIRITKKIKEVMLNDSAGADSFTIKDSDGFPIFKVDSKGNIKARGGIGRI